jgi:hypothetical protein
MPLFLAGDPLLQRSTASPIRHSMLSFNWELSIYDMKLPASLRLYFLFCEKGLKRAVDEVVEGWISQ